MIKKGDKIVLKAPMGIFTNIGEICPVLEVESGVITFSFNNGMHMGCMSADEYEKYFDKYEEPKVNTVTQEQIDEILDNSEIEAWTVFDKCTVVVCQLPNGFVLVESSACVSPENYDEEMGVEICMNKITDKVWELEGYKLQEKLHKENYPCDCFDCNECDCDECDCDEESETFDECLDTDLDCDYCEDYDCPFNTNFNNNK